MCGPLPRRGADGDLRTVTGASPTERWAWAAVWWAWAAAWTADRWAWTAVRFRGWWGFQQNAKLWGRKTAPASGGAVTV